MYEKRYLSPYRALSQKIIKTDSNSTESVRQVNSGRTVIILKENSRCIHNEKERDKK